MRTSLVPSPLKESFVSLVIIIAVLHIDLFAEAGIFNSVDIRQLDNVNVSGHAFPPDAQVVIDAAGLLKE